MSETARTDSTSYPLFLPPDALAEKGSDYWSKSESEQYLDWLVDAIDTRLSGLAGYLKMDIQPKEAASTLSVCGTRVALAVQLPDFSLVEDGIKKLSPSAGYSIGADVGLLFAHLLLYASGSQLAWSIGRGPKSYVSRNLPVIVGFTDNMELDPVLVGINMCRRVLREGSASSWQQVYEHWRQRIPVCASA